MRFTKKKQKKERKKEKKERKISLTDFNALPSECEILSTG
jgi:hypothetical protein